MYNNIPNNFRIIIIDVTHIQFRNLRFNLSDNRFFPGGCIFCMRHKVHSR